MLTIAEVAKLLNCSRETVRRWIIKGDLPAQRIGNAWAVALADVEPLL